MLVHLINLKPEEMRQGGNWGQDSSCLEFNLGGGNHLQYLALQGKKNVVAAQGKSQEEDSKGGMGRREETEEGREGEEEG